MVQRLKGVVQGLKDEGITRACIEIYKNNIFIEVPEGVYIRRAYDIVVQIVPEHYNISVRALPWWKNWIKRYQLIVTGDGPRNEPRSEVHIRRSR